MEALRLGMRGIEVRKVQLLLNAHHLPLPRLRPDGSFGLKTDEAVRCFQGSRKLNVDGVVGSATWRALGLNTKPNAVTDNTVKRDWMEIARAEEGIHEDAAPGCHTQRIIEYHATTTLRATTDEVAWCSSFVNWVLQQAGYRGTNSAAAKSWLKWGTELKEPRVGAITVTKKKGADVANGSTSGFHVAFYWGSSSGTRFMLLGGNQGNAVRIREYDSKKYESIAYRWLL